MLSVLSVKIACQHAARLPQVKRKKKRDADGCEQLGFYLNNCGFI